jgi:CheY-like chemotaxis protein
VLQNLLSNSAKYTPPRGRLLVRARKAGDQVEVAVEDAGAGIAPELLPNLFDPFVQGERTFVRARGGLGLGLALVQSLVSLHGGTVRATSDGVGRGTVMTVRLPAARPRRAPVPRAACASDVGVVPSVGRRVLVVDDNVDAAEMLAIMLRRRGHVVEVAHDGPSALEVFDRFRPDAALLDIGLPVMDGYELAMRVQRRADDVLLVAVTGYGQETDRERSRAVGFAHHLVKPVNTKELLAILAASSAHA